MSSTHIKKALAELLSEAVHIQVANGATKLAGVHKIEVKELTPLVTQVKVATLTEGTIYYNIKLSEVN